INGHFLRNFRSDRHRPWRVDLSAERGEDADPPVAEVVDDALDDDGAVVGNRSRRRVLIFEILKEIARRELVEVVLLHEALDRVLRFGFMHFTNGASDCHAERYGGLLAIGPPARLLSRLSRCRTPQLALLIALFS